MVLAVLFGLLVALPACEADLPYVMEDCAPAERDGHSAARIWDDQLLALIRQVVPAPTVHARNLFHLSAAMWDAWAAYDDQADGYFVTEKQSASDVTAAREAAISFAAYRILLWRYFQVTELEEADEQLAETMATLCYRTDYATTEGDNAAALGNRIAEAVIAYGATDGALEAQRYVDDSYRPVNEPLIVAEPGTVMADPSRWQPLALERQVSQNGLPIPGQVQTFIGPNWGHVTSFALPPNDEGVPIDPGPPPALGGPSDEAFKDAADRGHPIQQHAGPDRRGDHRHRPRLDGQQLPGLERRGRVRRESGHRSAVRGERTLRADFARTLAEFWADGPRSETPPGHWNVVANTVSDSPGFAFRIGGEGDEVDRLEWDVKLYLALNGAVHDAAIAAWGLKGYYDSARPISMIRYMGGLGQSSDPNGPSYDPEGLPLVDDLVEVITPESSAAGARHAHLADHVGEIAILAWRGFPADPETETSGVGWIRAVDWVPYQRSTFVTPAFAGYVSGHSTFSRAAAEVLTAFTGSPYFPGGLSEWTTPAGELKHEEGPAEDVTLQWATYYDAADQAGLSRLFMGIHISADDFEGRSAGAICGRDAWVLATQYFDGSARP